MKKIMLFAAVSVFLFPAFASADTVAELQAKIANLLAQVQELQIKISQIQNQNTTQWCHTFNTNIGVGSSGDEVYSLSLALQKEGFGLGKFDGYDEKVASAVSSFQNKYKDEILTSAGLAYPTGYVGGRTRAKLNSLYGCKASYNPEPLPNPVACTMEAKLCSDGVTWVGRGGPACEFTKCPELSDKVSVVYPNGGEKFLSEKGAFVAKWKSNSQNVDVYLIYDDSQNNLAQTIGSNISGNSLEVIVNSALLQKDVNSYKLKICLTTNSSVCDTSDKGFSFVSTDN